MNKFIAHILILFVIVGCASQPKLSELEFHLTQNDIASLPAPNLHQEISHQQLLTTSVRGREISFIGIVTVKNNQIELLALTPVGIRIFHTSFNGKNVTTTQYIPNIPLPNMTEVLANIMLAYYSPEAWKNHLPSGWTIIDNPTERQILDANNKTIFKISLTRYGQESIPSEITNIPLNYTITLKNLKN